MDCTVMLYIWSLSVYVNIVTLLGYDRVLENRFGVLESTGVFCKRESGNPVY